MLCGSLATGRVSLDGRVKGNNPEQKGCPRPSGWGLGVGLKSSAPQQNVIVEKFNNRHQMGNTGQKGMGGGRSGIKEGEAPGGS